MPSKIQRIKINSGAIASDGSATAYSNSISGRILAVHVNYPANTCTVDINTDGELKSQEIINLSAANTDAVYYPRVALCDTTGTALDLSDESGGDVAMYDEFVVHGRLKLTIASGTEDQTVSVDVIFEAY